MNALLYSANTTTQALTAGQTIGFGTPVRRYGRNIQLSGGNIAIHGEGYYPMVANFTGVAGAAGIVGIQLYEDGAAIPGATSSVTVGANGTFTLAIPATIKIRCCEEKIITAELIAVDANITNASILVGKA